MEQEISSINFWKPWRMLLLIVLATILGATWSWFVAIWLACIITLSTLILDTTFNKRRR